MNQNKTIGDQMTSYNFSVVFPIAEKIESITIQFYILNKTLTLHKIKDSPGIFLVTGTLCEGRSSYVSKSSAKLQQFIKAETDGRRPSAGIAPDVITGAPDIFFGLPSGGGKYYRNRKLTKEQLEYLKIQPQHRRKKLLKDPCWPSTETPECVKIMIKDNPWMLEKGGDKYAQKVVGKKSLLNKEIRKKKNKTKKKKKYKKKSKSLNKKSSKKKGSKKKRSKRR